MSYLLDTNILSETVKRRPAPGVLDWLRRTPEEALHISVLSLGEIRSGIERIAPGERRERLRHWLEHDIVARFGARILPVDAAVAQRWGRLLADTRSRTMPAIDGLLAATALSHDLFLATRNEADFAHAGVATFNPWREA